MRVYRNTVVLLRRMNRISADVLDEIADEVLGLVAPSKSKAGIAAKAGLDPKQCSKFSLSVTPKSWFFLPDGKGKPCTVSVGQTKAGKQTKTKERNAT